MFIGHIVPWQGVTQFPNHPGRCCLTVPGHRPQEANDWEWGFAGGAQQPERAISEVRRADPVQRRHRPFDLKWSCVLPESAPGWPQGCARYVEVSVLRDALFRGQPAECTPALVRQGPVWRPSTLRCAGGPTILTGRTVLCSWGNTFKRDLRHDYINMVLRIRPTASPSISKGSPGSTTMVW